MHNIEFKSAFSGLWTPSRAYPHEYTAAKAADILAHEANSPTPYRAVPPLSDAAAPPPVPLTGQKHYASKPEPIEVIEGWKLNYNMGCAMKYIGRAGKKGDTNDHIKDLEKAISYLRREVNTLKGNPSWE